MPQSPTKSTEEYRVEINRHREYYSFDTGAAMSFISEAEAARPGLRVESSDARVGNIAGNAIGLRTAVADRLQIGDCELAKFAFMVFSDDQPPFKSVPINHRGVIGTPVLGSEDDPFRSCHV